jgi:hypothetical protein
MLPWFLATYMPASPKPTTSAFLSPVRSAGNGNFDAPQLAIANFGYEAGGWRVERHPRFLADVTGDRRADVVGFGDGGAWVSRNSGKVTRARGSRSTAARARSGTPA